jgi:hypothetical protein
VEIRFWALNSTAGTLIESEIALAHSSGPGARSSRCIGREVDSAVDVLRMLLYSSISV